MLSSYQHYKVPGMELNVLNVDRRMFDEGGCEFGVGTLSCSESPASSIARRLLIDFDTCL